MLVAYKSKENMIKVYDSDDNTIEPVPLRDLNNAMKNGLKVLGIRNGKYTLSTWKREIIMNLFRLSKDEYYGEDMLKGVNFKKLAGISYDGKNMEQIATKLEQLNLSDRNWMLLYAQITYDSIKEYLYISEKYIEMLVMFGGYEPSRVRLEVYGDNLIAGEK